jgi:hypothetical protein
MPFTAPLHGPATRKTFVKHLRTGALVMHGNHITPLLITAEKNSEGKRLAISLGGNAEWLAPGEPVVAYSAEVGRQMTLFGSRLSQMALEHKPRPPWRQKK